MRSHKYSNVISTFIFSGLFVFLNLGTIALAEEQKIASRPVLSKLERAQNRGLMRRYCITLSKQFMTLSYDRSLDKVMTDRSKPDTLILPFETVYEKCLMLSDDEKGYSPNIIVLSDALEHQEQMTTFTIHTQPKQALVKILNILPAYRKKMAVPPGLYHVVIEKKGFQKWDKWLKISGKNYIHHAKLIQKKQAISNVAQQTDAKTNPKLAASQAAILKEKAEALAKIQYWAARVMAQKKAQKAALIAARQAEERAQAMAEKNKKQVKWVTEMERSHKASYQKTITAGKREREERIARMKAMTLNVSLSTNQDPPQKNAPQASLSPSSNGG